MYENGANVANQRVPLPALNHAKTHWNLLPEQLIEAAVRGGHGLIADNGALCIRTGAFTGRSPRDRFIVKDDMTRDSVDWNQNNLPFEPQQFNQLRKQMLAYMDTGEVYVQDLHACADPHYRLNIRVIAGYPWSAHFANNMFIWPDLSDLKYFEPDWHLLCAPGFTADPATDGTRQGNFAIISFAERTVIIGGTGYTGEIKKSIFSVLNFLLPEQHGVLPMHCSANVGQDGDTAIYFGLSGTGKTTLSADPRRQLIGDDEHGWSEDGVFNFEGGCYAKCIDLSEEKEPDIYRAIRHGAILENVVFHEGTRTPDYSDASVTQNTRVSYPLHHIPNVMKSSRGGHPKNVFFLTCDAFGVLPPISRLTPAQAMYHFISGYTAKVAGTEEGVNEPQATFSACFGAPFMPLHPTRYATMLGGKMHMHNVDVWLVNTGWTGGPYGIGSRINLKYTRAIIAAALHGELAAAEYAQDPIMGLHMPQTCPGVPSDVLDPITTWPDADAYRSRAVQLAQAFVSNFEKYAPLASDEILGGAPLV